MRDELVSVDIDGTRAFVSVVGSSGQEEVSTRGALDLQAAFDASAGAARKAITAVSDLEWTSAKVTLGVEFALESGSLVAVFGKANAKSSISIELEFIRDAPAGS